MLGPVGVNSLNTQASTVSGADTSQAACSQRDWVLAFLDYCGTSCRVPCLFIAVLQRRLQPVCRASMLAGNAGWAVMTSCMAFHDRPERRARLCLNSLDHILQLQRICQSTAWLESRVVKQGESTRSAKAGEWGEQARQTGILKWSERA